MWNIKVRKFKKQFLKNYDLDNYHLEILDGICENLFIFYRATKQISEDGPTIMNDRKMIRKHPANEVAKSAWSSVINGLKYLAAELRISDKSIIPDYPGKPGRKKKY